MNKQELERKKKKKGNAQLNIIIHYSYLIRFYLFHVCLFDL